MVYGGISWYRLVFAGIPPFLDIFGLLSAFFLIFCVISVNLCLKGREYKAFIPTELWNFARLAVL